jgi:hypothetical protein
MPDDWSVCGGIVETTAQKLRRILWGTESTPRWVWFLLGFGLAALLLSGCGTMQAYQAEQARWQAKADQATRAQVMVRPPPDDLTPQERECFRAIDAGA